MPPKSKKKADASNEKEWWCSLNPKTEKCYASYRKKGTVKWHTCPNDAQACQHFVDYLKSKRKNHKLYKNADWPNFLNEKKLLSKEDYQEQQKKEKKGTTPTKKTDKNSKRKHIAKKQEKQPPQKTIKDKKTDKNPKRKHIAKKQEKQPLKNTTKNKKQTDKKSKEPLPSASSSNRKPKQDLLSQIEEASYVNENACAINVLNVVLLTNNKKPMTMNEFRTECFEMKRHMLKTVLKNSTRSYKDKILKEDLSTSGNCSLGDFYSFEIVKKILQDCGFEAVYGENHKKDNFVAYIINKGNVHFIAIAQDLQSGFW